MLACETEFEKNFPGAGAGHGLAGCEAVEVDVDISDFGEDKRRVTEACRLDVLGETLLENSKGTADEGVTKFVGKELDKLEETGVGAVGNVHGGKRGANSCNPSIMCHQHAHNLSSSPLSGSLPCGGSSVEFGGSPGWARGRASARLSSSWCCPGCGLYGDGSLCMVCDTHGVGHSSTDNSDLNLHLGCRHEHREGTKTLRASSGIKVGCRSVRKCETGGLFKKCPNKLADRGVGVQAHFVSPCCQGGVFSRRRVRGCVNQVAAR